MTSTQFVSSRLMFTLYWKTGELGFAFEQCLSELASAFHHYHH
jgi:hypothetical protein